MCCLHPCWVSWHHADFGCSACLGFHKDSTSAGSSAVVALRSYLGRWGCDPLGEHACLIRAQALLALHSRQHCIQESAPCFSSRALCPSRVLGHLGRVQKGSVISFQIHVLATCHQPCHSQDCLLSVMNTGKQTGLFHIPHEQIKSCFCLSCARQ